MATLMKVSRTLDDMLNRASNRHAPYVGESAFVTKTGIHASAVLKDPQTYEHVPPTRWAITARCWSRIRPAAPT